MITERHLFLALEAHRLSEDEELLDVAMEAILLYASHYLADNDLPIDDDSIIEYCKKLSVDHLLDRMIQTGLIEEDFDGHLSLTEKGEQVANEG